MCVCVYVCQPFVKRVTCVPVTIVMKVVTCNCFCKTYVSVTVIVKHVTYLPRLPVTVIVKYVNCLPVTVIVKHVMRLPVTVIMKYVRYLPVTVIVKYILCLPVTVVVKLVETGHGYDPAPGRPEGEEHLQTRLNPHLKQRTQHSECQHKHSLCTAVSHTSCTICLKP